jgi:hypothetical protein
MYDVVILNFGESTRVFYDASNEPVCIPTGEMKECRLGDETARFLFKSQRTDTICLMRRHVEVPVQLRRLFDTLRDVMTMSYDNALAQTIDLVGHQRLPGPRPTRTQLREALGRVTRTLCADVAPNTPLPERVESAPVKGDAPDLANVMGFEAVPNPKPAGFNRRERAKINSTIKSSTTPKKAKKSGKKRAR